MRRFGFLVIAILIAIGCVGCSNHRSQAATSQPKAEVPKVIKPTAFIRMQEGDRWEYDVKLTSDTDPLHCETIAWAKESGESILVDSRGAIEKAAGLDRSKTYKLVLQLGRVVEGLEQSAQKGDAREVEIVKDEVGIFEDQGLVVWTIGRGAINGESYFVIIQMGFYRGDYKHAPTTGGTLEKGEDGQIVMTPNDGGYKMGSYVRPIYLAKEPEAFIRMNDRAPLERLSVESLTNEEIHLTRKVEHGGERPKTGIKELDDASAAAVKGFEEKLVYRKGRGLTSLKQIIDGKTVMTWTLAKFTPGK